MEPFKTSLNAPLTRDELSRIFASTRTAPQPPLLAEDETTSAAEPKTSEPTPLDAAPDTPAPEKPAIQAQPTPVTSIPAQQTAPTTAAVTPLRAPGPNLDLAIRRARIDAAEQAQGFADLRSAEIARLHALQEALEPVFGQLPHGQDLFDTGLIPGEIPRLFIDMIAFVQMGRDKRTYEFRQDRRDGRLLLAQSQDVNDMARAVTDYIARRLVQRERALATTEDEPSHWPRRRATGSSAAQAQPAPAQPNPAQTAPQDSASDPSAPAHWPASARRNGTPIPQNAPSVPSATTASAVDAPSNAPRTRYVPVEAHQPRRHHGWFIRLLLFLVEFFGVASLTAALIAAGFFLYLRLSGLH